MASKVTKYDVKHYLDSENKSLGNEMQRNIDNPDEWNSFKEQLAILVSDYSKNTTFVNKLKLNSLISSNYTTHEAFGNNALENILEGLNISIEASKNENDKKTDSKREEYLRSIYESIGIEFPADIIKKIDEEVKTKLNSELGVIKRTPEELSRLYAPDFYETNETNESNEKVISPKAIEKTTKKINNSSEKLEEMIEVLKKAHKMESSKTKVNQRFVVSDDIKAFYAELSNPNLSEQQIEDIENRLSDKLKEQIESTRKMFHRLQASELDDKLTDLVEKRFAEMSEEEKTNEIKALLIESRVDADGKIVLPKNSCFKSILLNQDGEIRDEYRDLVELLITYTSIPKAYELSDSQVLDLAKKYKDVTQLNPKSKEYAVAKFLSDNPDKLPENSQEIMDRIDIISREHGVVMDMSKQAETNHKIILAEDIREQFEMIKDYLKGLTEKEQSNDSDEKNKAEKILKLAKNKVDRVNKAGLNKVMSKGQKESNGILRRAEGVLLTKLKNARDNGKEQLKTILKDDDRENAG